MTHRIGNGIMGAAWGVLIGGLMGLGVCMFIIDEPPFFPGDTIVIGAAACGVLAFFIGEPFLVWIKDNWWDFT